MHKRTGVLLGLLGMALGTVLGFLIAPIKAGINIECGNTHAYAPMNDNDKATDE